MKSKHNEISIEIPEDWADHSSVTLVAPFDESGMATTIVVTKNYVGGHQTLEEFVQYQLQILEESMPEFTLLDSWENEISGRECFQQLHHFQTENGVFQQVQTFFIENGIVYTITGTSAMDEFAKYIDTFRDAVLSFKIEKL